MMLVLLDYDGGLDDFVGTALLQPIIGGLISAGSIVFCFLLGLPIRLSMKTYRLWKNSMSLMILGTLAGFTLIVYALLNSHTTAITIEDEVIQKELPDVFVVTGWFLMAFCMLHTFPSDDLERWASQKISYLLGKLNKS